MNIYNPLAKYIMAPSLDILRGTQTTKCWKDLESSQWWPRERILELQNRRLNRMVKYAYENVSYYHRKFDEIGVNPLEIKNSQDLIKLPFLDKKEIRDNFNQLTSLAFPVKQRIKLYTSGSSGQQLFFYTTKHQHTSLAFGERQRGFTAIGIELGDKCTRLGIANNQRSGPIFWQRAIDALKRDKLFDVHEMIDDKMHQFAGSISRFQPRLLRGFPSIVYELARFIHNNKQYRIKPLVIVTGGEQLFDYQRTYFREVFGCDTYDFYSAEEQHTIATECPSHKGYHLVAENVILEVIDSNGKPVSPGKEGEIAITNLHNFAMPMIRYKIGDIGILTDKICPCGRGLPLLVSLSGRIYDLIITKSKRVIPGQYLVQPLRELYARLNLAEFQIVQESPGKAIIKVVPGVENSRNNADIVSSIIAGYRNVLGDEIEISVELVGKIPRSSAGKLRKVISIHGSQTGKS
jgi:phenylacetate-CoA ligase